MIPVASRTGRPPYRPPRVPGAKVVVVTIEMTVEERAVLKEAAELNGQSMADFVRINAGGAASDELELRKGERRQAQVDVAEERRSGSDRRKGE